MDFSGKTILITGGARGIGRAVAVAFAGKGGRVVIGDVDDAAYDVVAAIQASGSEAAFVRTDVTDRDAVDALVSYTTDKFGSLDAAFNNAGILPAPAPFAEFDFDQFDRTIAVDLVGVFNCMRAELRVMAKVGKGAIVNTSSVGGVIANPNMAPYVAAKHGVIGLTKAAAIEYAQQGIRVNAIAPGLVRTDMTSAWFDTPGFMEAFLAASPIGRPAEPEEMAGMVLHLCSDEASFTNGQVFVIDGGQTAI